MVNKQRKNKKIFWLIIGAVVALLLIAMVTRFIRFEVMWPMKTYHSEFLDITFKYPSEYQLEERFGTIILKKSTNQLVTISRIGTNNDSIEGFLFELSDRNKVQISNKQKLNINGYEFTSAIINHPLSKTPGTRIYYFYNNNFVYSISTRSTELYNDLDKIAQSFRYEP